MVVQQQKLFGLGPEGPGFEYRLKDVCVSESGAGLFPDPFPLMSLAKVTATLRGLVQAKSAVFKVLMPYIGCVGGASSAVVLVI